MQKWVALVLVILVLVPISEPMPHRSIEPVGFERVINPSPQNDPSFYGSRCLAEIPARIIRNVGKEGPSDESALKVVIDDGGFFGLGRMASVFIEPESNSSDYIFKKMVLVWESGGDRESRLYYAGSAIELDKRGKGMWRQEYEITNNLNKYQLTARGNNEFQLRIKNAYYIASVYNHKPEGWIAAKRSPAFNNVVSFLYGGWDQDHFFKTYSPFNLEAKVQIDLYVNDKWVSTQLIETTFDVLCKIQTVEFRDLWQGGDRVYAKIRIFDGLDWSEWEQSEPIIIPKRDLPTLGGSYSNRRVLLNWTSRINSAEISSYELQRSENGVWKSIANLSNAHHVYVDTNILPGKIYGYRMRTRTWTWSDWSNEVSVQTPSIGGFEFTVDSNCWWAFGTIFTTRSQISGRLRLKQDAWTTILQETAIEILGLVGSISYINTTEAFVTIELPIENVYTMNISLEAFGSRISRTYTIQRIAPLYGEHQLIGTLVRGDLFIAISTAVDFSITINRNYSQIDWSESFIRFYDSVRYYSLNSYFKNKSGPISEQIRLPITGDGKYYVDFMFRFTGGEIYTGLSDFYVDCAEPELSNIMVRRTDFEFRLTEQFPESASYRIINSNTASNLHSIPLKSTPYTGELLTVSYPTDVLELVAQHAQAQLMLHILDKSGKYILRIFDLPAAPSVQYLVGLGSLPNIQLIRENETVEAVNSPSIYFRTLNTQLRSISVYLDGFLYRSETTNSDSVVFPLEIAKGNHSVEIHGITEDYRSIVSRFSVESKISVKITAVAAVRLMENQTVAAIRWSPIPGALKYHIAIADPTNYSVPDFIVNGSDYELVIPVSELQSLSDSSEGSIVVVAITESGQEIVMSASFSIPRIVEPDPDPLMEVINGPSFKYVVLLGMVVIGVLMRSKSANKNRVQQILIQSRDHLRTASDAITQNRENLKDLSVNSIMVWSDELDRDQTAKQLGLEYMGWLNDSDFQRLLEEEADDRNE